MPKLVGVEDPDSLSSSEPFSYLNCLYLNCLLSQLFISWKIFKFLPLTICQVNHLLTIKFF